MSDVTRRDDYTDISANDSATDVTGAELEELSDGSETTLHSHAGGAGGAPTDATYITQTANGSLSAEQALGSLATGILKNTTTTGVLSIATAGTDYLTDVVQDTTPQLGGNLDLNTNDITGTGDINITGTIGSSGTISTSGNLTANIGNVNAGAGVLADNIFEFSAGSGVDVDGVLLKDGLVDGVDVAAEETRLANTSGTNTGDQDLSSYQVKPVEGAFVDGDKTKLDGIETGADVTDTTNVTAAGALMDSEVDADIKTLSLPASTTISTFGASLIDDTTNTAARSTLGLGSLATLSTVNNSNWSGTDLSVANGGTGASTASAALQNLLADWDGWIEAGETWTYASNTTHSNTNTVYEGTFTITGDKTDKYQVGMRIKFDQTTDGTKYGIITDKSYAAPNTTIRVFMGSDYDMDNETISNPYYSMQKAPVGFPAAPESWTTYREVTSNNNQASPTASTWYRVGSTLGVPTGRWRISMQANCQTNASLPTNTVYAATSLSTNDAGAPSNGRLTGLFANEGVLNRTSIYVEDVVSHSSTTTYYHNMSYAGSTATQLYVIASSTEKVVYKAECAYL